MMKRVLKQRERPCRQRGAVLIFALLLLLVMTVLGVSGVGNSVLEERMSGNFHQTYSAMQAAETALRVAEDWLVQNVTSSSNWPIFQVGGSTGLYTTQHNSADEVCQGVSGCAFDPTNEAHWCSPSCNELPKGYVALGSNDLGTGSLLAIDSTLVSQQPRFIIEYIGRAGEQVGNLAMGGTVSPPDIRKYSFRITAIGWGREATTRYVLQSHFQMPLY